MLTSTEGITFNTKEYQKAYLQTYLHKQDLGAIPLRELASFGIFRLATFKLRRDVYQYGAWLFASDVEYSGVLRPVAEMFALAELTTANATKLRFMFIHNSITHSPYGLNEQCQIDPKHSSHPFDEKYHLPEGHYNSEYCALRWLGAMLTRLQELGVYDNTQIFITADHGAQGVHLPGQGNYHIPLFYKPFNAQGDMKQDSRLITNYDIPRIFCANLPNGCPNVAPNILERFPYDRKVLTFKALNRRFEDQNNKPNTKNAFNITDFYTIHGDMYEKSNWRKLESSELHKLDLLPLDSSDSSDTREKR